mmetsp:Transcript_9424/g.20864  ORF Transcript_9424/g.20864 Transcript_9424/m.20864 type:complete len:150 (+) Transcript_9424:341-790(+)
MPAIGVITDWTPYGVPRAHTNVQAVQNYMIAEQIQKIAECYFYIEARSADLPAAQRSSLRQMGGVYSGAARSIRGAPLPITTTAYAITLAGVGGEIAARCEEFRNTGTIVRLQELQARAQVLYAQEHLARAAAQQAADQQDPGQACIMC